ncbi:MAG: peptidoglycan DD-metalloendopeptidase family protein [Armatimonadetes bacterium]|nr:peptidoglycan DD-metalloendopeptidase family protein [Armatimonadota bacterium]
MRHGMLRGIALLLGLGTAACGVAADDHPAVGAVQLPLSFTPNLPYPAGTAMGVSQGWNGTYSHFNKLKYGIDFNLPGTADLGIHVLAVADGVVTYRYEECTEGCATCTCNSGWGNAIVIDHGAGEFSKYTHFLAGSIPDWIVVGTPVCRGLHVGDIGTTGASDGTHLHFQFQSDGTLSGPSIPFDKFAETAGVPEQGGGPYMSTNEELESCAPPAPCSVAVGLGVTVIDDETDCFKRTGQYWWEESYGYEDHHWYTYTIAEAVADSTATWEVNVIQADDYEVEVFVPDNPDSLTQKVTYSVRHAGTVSDAVVNQADERGKWAVLGTYSFAEGGDQYVRILDNTGEPYVDLDGPRLLADAVRLTSVTICSDECSAGLRCAGDQAWEECGDFDDDPCLEWGGGADCESGTHCQGEGECKPSSDAGTGGDGSGGDGGDGDGVEGSADGGCGCKTAGAGPGYGGAVRWLAALVLAARYRRGRRRDRRSRSEGSTTASKLAQHGGKCDTGA